MQTRRFVRLLCWFVLCTVPFALAESGTNSTADRLPASLDALYPPQSPRPAFLQAMHELNIALAGIVVDISEDDLEGAFVQCEDFAARYLDTSSMVPEWESMYPAEPVEALRAAVAAGGRDAVMEAVGKVGAVCHDCHLATMVAAQQRYHWPEFAKVMVEDPVSGGTLPYAAFMQMLNVSLVGIGVDLKEGEPEQARTHLEAFRSRMRGLRDSCDSCHATERRYFVDGDIELLLSGLAGAMASPTVDQAAVAHLSRRVAEEACAGCHLVHMPAAYARAAIGH